MNVQVMSEDLVTTRWRTRASMMTSAVFHALLIILLLLVKPATPAPPLTEIQWLEPEEAQAAAAAASPSGPEVVAKGSPGAPATSSADEHFRRAATPAEIEPRPQSDLALSDKLSARLSTLQGSESSAPVVSGSVGAPSGMLNAPAVPAGASGTGTPLGLHRGGESGTSPALALTRGGGGGGTSAALAPAGLPQGAAAPAAAAGGGDASAHRMLAGASLIGPVADRPVLHYQTPVYPDWAKRDGVEASVTLYFVVTAEGAVRENVLVQKTAGFEDFDENARTALRAWRFEPLHGGRTGEQWGTITFHFRLSDAN